MHKIHFVADKKKLVASGVDVTVVGLGDMLRPENLPPGQWAIAVGARGGSMWQLISRPLASREDAEAAMNEGFEPITTEVALRWSRSLLASGLVRVISATPDASTVVRVSGKRRQLKELNEAYAKAEAHFGRLRVSNAPTESEPPGFSTVPVPVDEAKAYRNWFEETYGVKRGAIVCELSTAPVPR